MKYCLSPKEIPRAKPEWFPEGSGNISSYTRTRVTIQLQYAKRTNSCVLLQRSPLRNKGTSEKSVAAVPIWKVGKDINVVVFQKNMIEK